ncbi:MAG: BCCT family transporter [Halioglobus sp.]|nr:BCCT family transporter [Halioglobus sp.]
MTRKYRSRHRVGEQNIQIFGMDIHNPVFFISATLILLFVVATIQFPERASEVLAAVRGWCLVTFDGFMMASVSLLLLFALALIFLPVGKVRLGGEKATPEFSRLSWMGMLFAAGMGIGLMFWGVAEPMSYFTGSGGTPFGVEPWSEQAADMAMAATMYHWGLHAWAIYAVVALALAFFCFNCGLPLTLRSAFYPILGERVWGWPGHVIDTFAVVATMFGLATSLGLGASQVNAGMSMLFGVEDGLNTKLSIIIFVTFIAIISVVRGLDGGVKVLSNLNMGLAALLLVFIAIAGNNIGLFVTMLETTGSYLRNIVPLSNWVNRADEQWMHDWTVFYWAWWISWSPFVGMFIARVSRGRTVREFLVAVLIVPTVVTVAWMSVFGRNAIYQAQNGIGDLADGITSVSLASFEMLQSLPLSGVTSLLAMVLVMVFFITSSDSGSLVIDGITAGGKLDAPVPQRIFWATMEGLLAGALLYGGGKTALSALQAGTVAAGIPFTVILLLMCFSLYRGLTATLKEPSLVPMHEPRPQSAPQVRR